MNHPQPQSDNTEVTSHDLQPSKHRTSLNTSTKRLKKILKLAGGGLALVLLMVWMVFGLNKSSADWNYAIELTMQTPDGPKTGRVVRTNAIAMHGGLITQPGGSQKITGEALAMEIMPGQWLFGLVNDSGFPVRYQDVEGRAHSNREISRMMRWYENRPEGYGRDIVINPQTVYEKIPEGATREEERAIQSRNRALSEQAPRETYPGTLVTFTDINDPTTIQLVDLADLEATFGKGVRFVSGRYEYTKAPRNKEKILSIVPWPQDQGLSVVPIDVRRQASAFAETSGGWKLYIDWNDFIER